MCLFPVLDQFYITIHKKDVNPSFVSLLGEDSNLFWKQTSHTIILHNIKSYIQLVLLVVSLHTVRAIPMVLLIIPFSLHPYRSRHRGLQTRQMEAKITVITKNDIFLHLVLAHLAISRFPPSPLVCLHSNHASYRQNNLQE